MEKRYKVAGIGELLWDILPSGKQAGGAPFNFAFHAGQAGCESYMFSAVGRDASGEEIVQKAIDLGINSRYIQKNRYATGTVTVKLNESFCPNYIIHENVAWDYIQWNEDLKFCAGLMDAVCFGSLAQRNPASAWAIKSFLTALNLRCLKVFDINLRQHYFTREMILDSIQLSDVLKLNQEELPVVSGYLGLQEKEVKDQLRQLLHMFNLKCIAYTMGSRGSIVMTSDICSLMSVLDVKYAAVAGRESLYCHTIYNDIGDWRQLTEKINTKQNKLIFLKNEE
jgi:fructokinase